MSHESSAEIARLVERELSGVQDAGLVGRIRTLLVAPYPVEREWNYGAPSQRYTCWTVLEHQPSNTSIVFCAEGFGPSYPWGLVCTSGSAMNMGMDSAWYASLADAMRGSMAWDEPHPEGYEVP